MESQQPHWSIRIFLKRFGKNLSAGLGFVARFSRLMLAETSSSSDKHSLLASILKTSLSPSFSRPRILNLDPWMWMILGESSENLRAKLYGDNRDVGDCKMA